MYLDNTILQSRTTLTLVDFIKKIWPLVKPSNIQEAEDLLKEYKTIVNSAKEAEKKRSFQ